jgi:lambda family phage portal protein
MIGTFSPGWAARREYDRAVLGAIEQLSDRPAPDTRSFPRDYRRGSKSGQALPSGEASLMYSGSYQGRLDNQWPMSRAYKGVNAPLNRWRLTRLRDRSRQLDREYALATGMLDRATENVIGHGMRNDPTTGDPETDERLRELWPAWWDTADLTGMFGGVELERLAHRSFLRDGDIGFALVDRGWNKAFVQPIEGDLIDTMEGGYDLAKRIVDGIQLNEDMRPIAYYVLGLAITGVQMESVPVPAKNFVFYARRKSFTQLRGEPCFAQVERLFDQIDGYVEASVVAARIAACQGLIVKKLDGGKIVGNLATQLNSKNNPQKVEGMEPGMIRYLNPGESIEQLKPNQPTQSFPDFVSSLIRFTGITMGLPLELVFLDFSRTTYSSARASLLQSYASFRAAQQLFINQVMAPIYRWRVEKWVRDGVLKIPNKLNADPRSGLPAKYLSHQWIAPGWAWIDPVKEIQAAMMEVDAGFNSEESICLQHGRTIAEVFASKKRAKDLAKKLQIDLARSGLTRDQNFTPSAQVVAQGFAQANAPDEKPIPSSSPDSPQPPEDGPSDAPETDE